MRLLAHTDASHAMLKSESVDRLAVQALIVPRQQPVLLARRVARVPVDGGAAPHFVAALGFELQHEALRRGWEFRHGAATVSVFELSRRRRDGAGAQPSGGEEDAWEAIGDGSLRLVEVLVHGTGELAPLAKEADAWVATLTKQNLVDLAPAAGARSAY